MSSLSLSALSVIEKAINLALKQDTPSQDRLQKLAGQQIFLYVEDFAFILQIHILEQGVMLNRPESLDDIELDPRLDTLVQGPSSAYRKLLDGDGFFDGDLRIQGNAQALMTLHKVMQNFELDWEGLLADHIGDLSAATLARLLRAKWSWSKEFATNVRMQLVHRLQTDTQLLPSKIEFDNFVDEIERFGTLIDRADARLRMLEKRKSQAS